jgi:hypothetical protein
MKTIVHHDARGPEETVHHLSPVVPAEPASGDPATGMRAAWLPDGAPSEDAGKLAESESRLFHRLAH